MHLCRCTLLCERLDGMFIKTMFGNMMQVPVDMVANAMLAAMAKHAQKPGLEVYQIASSIVNPLYFSNFMRLLEEKFQEDPLRNSYGQVIGTDKIKVYPSMDSYMDALPHLIPGAKVWYIMLLLL